MKQTETTTENEETDTLASSASEKGTYSRQEPDSTKKRNTNLRSTQRTHLNHGEKKPADDKDTDTQTHRDQKSAERQTK